MAKRYIPKYASLIFSVPGIPDMGSAIKSEPEDGKDFLTEASIVLTLSSE